MFNFKFHGEVRPAPGLRLVPKEESDALLKRQLKAAKALGTKWALHPANSPQRKAQP